MGSWCELVACLAEFTAVLRREMVARSSFAPRVTTEVLNLNTVSAALLPTTCVAAV